MKSEAFGVLLMAYGTPQTLDEVEAYYTHIRRGRKPTEEQLQELISRYEAIGGLSPLLAITNRQAQGMERLLRQLDPEREYRVYIGMKHASPFIEEAVRTMAEEGIRQAIGLVLAPHYSVMSVGSYIESAQAAIEKWNGPQITFIKQWHLVPPFIEAIATRIREALQAFPEGERAQVPVIFTAHSLPERILKMDDPYVEQLRETAAAVAEKVGHARWQCGWQSAGRTPEPWLGPDILDLLKQLYTEGTRSAVICPIGFVSDHLEILYDIDIECQALAKRLGMNVVRTRSLNADEDFLKALTATILQYVKRGSNEL
jgi:ferrochelatase